MEDTPTSRKPPSARPTLRVGLCIDVLIGWGGGVDLVVMTLRAMRLAEPENQIILLAPGAPPGDPQFTWEGLRYAIKDSLKLMLGRHRTRLSPRYDEAIKASELLSRIKAFYPDQEVCYSAGLDSGLSEAAAALGLDAIYLAMRLPEPRPGCALVGYVPDYQHRRLPQLFSRKEIAERDRVFDRLVGGSDAMVMNAKAVADDMKRFGPTTLPDLHVLPFSPNLNPEWVEDRRELLSAYGISGPYFIVCNQFWVHKDHLTAIRAMAELIRSRPDISLVCTGNTADYRDSAYFEKLASEARRLGLGANLHFLGHIPKRHQIELLKHAVALIQPTRFEGGPGGGATYEAIALGQRVLLSDIPVNLEADSGNVHFFPAGDCCALTRLMLKTLEETPRQQEMSALINISESNLRLYGAGVWTAIRSGISRRLDRNS